MGRVITFFSHKGGTGRTFLLSSVAANLAKSGARVICLDWDIEAPGLWSYFQPYGFKSETGLVDLLLELGENGSADWRRHVVSVNLKDVGTLDLIASTVDGAYPAKVHGLELPFLYEHRDLGYRVEQLRTALVNEYDFVLIDSRTGISDVSAICAIQLPDVLALVFRANNQSLQGTRLIADRVLEGRKALPVDRAGLTIVPILNQLDGRDERDLAIEWRRRAQHQVEDLVDPWAPADCSIEDVLNLTTVPYVSYWSFGERIPVLDDDEKRSDPDSITPALEIISRILVDESSLTAMLRARQLELSPESRDLAVSQYEPSNRPGSDYNRDLNESLLSSDTYTFQGATGKYAVARIHLGGVRFKRFRLIISDPTDESSIALRAERRPNPEQESERLTEDIRMTLAGVFEIREQCDIIQIYLAPDPQVDRLEIFDDCMFVTWFSDDSADNYQFPLAQKFMDYSRLYRSSKENSERHFRADNEANLISVSSDLTAADFLELLKQVADVELSEDEFQRYRDMFAAFVEQTPISVAPVLVAT